ncbi:MAG: M23 family metallopeptidase [Aquificota bacterium]|nr:MAG: M23 family metallopeptidase [Aquificota bacterium]
MKKGILLLSISFAFSYAVECKYHTVKKGETIEKIAKTYGVSLRELTSANKEIDPKKLKEGQKLCIPTKKASTKRAERKEETKEAYSYYTVKKGARLEHVAKATGVSLKELERLNPELKGRWLKAGTKVKLPATQKVEEKVVKSEPQVIKRQPEAFLEQAQEKEQKSSIPQNLKIDMPVDGKLVKGQKGVEILAPCSSSVRVVEDGKVIYSGGDLQAYGNMVIVEHDRFISLYAYNEENLVKRGEKVSKGQIIAKVGKKDGSDSCALRFEIRSKDGVPLDPTEYFKDLH